MLSAEEKRFLSSNAYIPEHILDLMLPISKGKPSLIEGYLYFSNDWIIFVGYPLGREFKTEEMEKILKEVIARSQPDYVWFIAPEISPSLSQLCQERKSDYYYKLELKGWESKKELMRLLRKASGVLSIERGRKLSKEHKELITEFIEREKPEPLIKALFLSMEDYIRISEGSVVLSAFDRNGKLTAFYIVELGAKDFAVYVVGAHSKRNYIPGASDLLFFEMITLAREHDKSYIHLGLGVNEGIRRFKEKWGGIPFLRYEFGGFKPGFDRTFRLLRALEAKL